MSVKKQPDGQYLVRWRENGRNRGRRFQRKGDADAWDREVKRRKKLGRLALELLTVESPTLGAWIRERWAPEHGATLDQTTRDRYASSYKLHAEQELDTVPLDQLDVARLRKWQADLMKAGVSAHAIIKTRTFLSSVLTHAAESGAIRSNPLRVVRPPKQGDKVPVRALAPITVETIRAVLLGAMATTLPARIRAGRKKGRHVRREYDVPDARSEATRIRDAVIVSLLAYTGVRPGELVALRWCDFKTKTLLVPIGKTRHRVVKLLPVVVDDLRQWRLASDRTGIEDYIFPRPTDGEMWSKSDWDNWRKKTWAKACRRAGFRRAPRPYDLRHSCASLRLAEGKTVHWVAKQLGHSPSLTLETYGHIIEEYEDLPPIDPVAEIAAAREDAGAEAVAA